MSKLATRLDDEPSSIGLVLFVGEDFHRKNRSYGTCFTE